MENIILLSTKLKRKRVNEILSVCFTLMWEVKEAD